MSLSSIEFNYIRTLVRNHAAIVLENGKEYLVETRLAPLVPKAGFTSLSALITHLQKSPFGKIHLQVIDSMTTNETSFFRDKGPFTTLKEKVLPELIEKRKAVRRLHIWCAASSTGQEPYSIAILIKENFPHILNWDLKIVATDISPKVLEQARKGIYNQLEVNRGLPSDLLVKYFQKKGLSWQLRDNIMRMVEFRELNLSKAWIGIGNIDIVFIRNVLIYFDISTKKDILKKIAKLLRRDGYLFLGNAETTLNLDTSYELVQYNRSVCYKLR